MCTVTVGEGVAGSATTGSADIAADLRRQIASARFLQNERLPPERLLAERYGVARGTVRQALRQLEALGFVERRAGSGTYVTWSEGREETDVTGITRPLELVDARFAVEPHMCRLAVLRATDAELNRLRGRLEAMEACENDSARFAQIDEEFHLALARCTQNPMIIWMMEKIQEVRSHVQWARMRLLTLNPEVIRLYNRQHRAVVDAIAERDPERAAQAMKAHLSAARATLVGVAE
ncbi:MAG: FadR family transcriptional regulator [Rhodobacteraceae bacterium]|nr:FadR family transcriptional regulator [Paracoccaceae bacterium]